MDEKSLSGAEYFLSYIDDKTHYAWVYFSSEKIKFLRNMLSGKNWWKIKVVKPKILHTDNGFTSSEFEAYPKTEGVRHELRYQRLQNKMVLQSV